MMISECCTKEKPLLRRAQSGDPDAIELFLAGYVPLLRALAKRFFCVSLSVQDLCQAGYIGLMLALEHYNAEQGASTGRRFHRRTAFRSAGFKRAAPFERFARPRAAH